MLDDTCYFLAFDNRSKAEACAFILNSPLVRSFLSAVVFPDSKRPVTKKILQRINIIRAADRIEKDSDLSWFKKEFGISLIDAIKDK